MPQRYGCLILQLCDKFIRSGKLRGNGYQPDSAACSLIQAAEHGNVRIPQIRFLLSALFGRGQERTFHMNTGNMGMLSVLLHL